MKEIEELSKLIEQRNHIDYQIKEIINRPAITGHIGEFIASKIFDIELETSASAKSIDGKFRTGDLKGKTVNIKFYPKKENLLDVKDKNSQPPDYYLVLTGPYSKDLSSLGKTRPLGINFVYLFESNDLLNKLEKRKVKIGVATSVIRDYWNLAEIYPEQRVKSIQVSNEKKRLLELFRIKIDKKSTAGKDYFPVNYKNNKQIEISNNWNGYCPESLLKGKKIRMRLNHWDFYESEETGLQICVLDGFFAVILNFRGEGKFRSTISYGQEVVKDQFLCPQNIDKFPFNNPPTIFNESDEIKNYIENIKEKRI